MQIHDLFKLITFISFVGNNRSLKKNYWSGKIRQSGVQLYHIVPFIDTFSSQSIKRKTGSEMAPEKTVFGRETTVTITALICFSLRVKLEMKLMSTNAQDLF